VACLSLVTAKTTFIFLGCVNITTPIVAYGYPTTICAAVTSILVNI